MREKNYKIIGWILIVIGLFFNPWVVEWLFSPDGKLDFWWKYAIIILAEVILILIGTITFNRTLTKNTLFVLSYTKKKVKSKPFISICTIIICLIIFESIFFVLNISQEDILIKFTKPSEKNALLGFWGIKNDSAQVAHYLKNGSQIFNVSYGHDLFGRRINNHSDGKPLILFGGSFTFGFGLNDNQTLNHFLSRISELDVYNYAFSTYGTQHMLVHLERKDFFSEINKTGGKAIYIFSKRDIRRTIGDLEMINRNYWKDMPYYKLENGEAIRAGTFELNRTWKTNWYKFIGKSNFVQYFNLRVPKDNDQHLMLVYKLIEKSKEVYEKKFGGEFLVLIHPFDKNKDLAKQLTELLQRNNITMLEIKNDSNLKNQEYKIPYDGHPTEEFNKIFAEEIVKQLT